MTLVWTEIKDTNGNKQHCIADNGYCKECMCVESTWIIQICYIKAGDKPMWTVMCDTCLKASSILCKKQHCPFCNKSKKLSINICDKCIDGLIEHTSQLYKICKVAESDGACKCKYCKVLGRCM